MCDLCNGTRVISIQDNSTYMITHCPNCEPKPQAYFDERYARLEAKLEQLER